MFFVLFRYLINSLLAHLLLPAPLLPAKIQSHTLQSPSFLYFFVCFTVYNPISSRITVSDTSKTH